MRIVILPLLTILFAPPAIATDPLHPFEPEKSIDEVGKELRDLVEGLEEAANQSASVFEPLTVDQMSFRPPDGSHTPRWNAEHMRGVVEKFVSSYLHSIDPRIEIVDRTPQQMPDDYQPSHPDWDGKQEAAAMREAAAFVKRYAYLMEDQDLDAPLPAGVVPRFFKTPRGLLTILTGHFDGHTGNVKKKFEADGWPQLR